MKVVPVEPIGVEIFWDNIKTLVKKAVTYSGGRHTVNSTKYLLKQRYFPLSLASSFGSFEASKVISQS